MHELMRSREQDQALSVGAGVDIYVDFAVLIKTVRALRACVPGLAVGVLGIP